MRAGECVCEHLQGRPASTAEVAEGTAAGEGVTRGNRGQSSTAHPAT